MMPAIMKSKNGIRFSAVIQPRASKNELIGWRGECLKIRLTSPPVEGEANRMCVKFLAKLLDVSPSQIVIVRGETSRNKTIEVKNLDETAFIEKIRLASPQNPED
jgi:hypothetical protein